MRDQFLLLAAILAQWQRPGASIEALELLYQNMHMVWYQHITMAIEMARNYGAILLAFFHATLAAMQYGANTYPITASSGFK